jgi:hypothetical protein
MVYGREGFVAWFYAIVYKKIQSICKNIYIKIGIHSIGMIMMVFGAYLMITAMPSLTSILGMLLMFLGIVVFALPFGAETRSP